MARFAFQRPQPAHSTLVDKAVDAVRQATHLSEEAHRLKSLATDAIDDGVHAAKRTLTVARRRLNEVADLRDEAAYRVKHDPLKAVALAFGAGVLVATVCCVGWWATRRIGAPSAD